MVSNKQVLMFVDGDTSIRDIKKHISQRPRPGRKSRRQLVSGKQASTPRTESSASTSTTSSSDVVAHGSDIDPQEAPPQESSNLSSEVIDSSHDDWVIAPYSPTKNPGSAVDPFGTTLFSRYTWVPRIFDVQMACPSPITFRYRQDTVIPQSEGGVEVIRSCLRDEVLLFCFALPASSIARYFLSPGGLQPLIHNRTWLQTEALKGLRSRLDKFAGKDTVDIALLLAIWRLFVAELADKRYDMAKIHMRAFQMLGANSRTPGPLGDFFQERLEWGDLNVGLETLTAPEFVPVTEPFPKERWQQLQSGFSASDRVIGVALSAWETKVDPDMYQLIGHVREWAQIHQYLSSSADPPASDVHWLSWRGNTLMAKLLSLNSGKMSSMSLDQTIQEMMRVTMIVWMAIFVSHPLMARYSSLVLPHLRKASAWVFDNTYEGMDTQLQNLVLWTLFVGACAEDEARVTDEEFMAALKERMRFSRVRGIIHFETLMNQFLYSKHFQKKSLERVWASRSQEEPGEMRRTST